MEEDPTPRTSQDTEPEAGGRNFLVRPHDTLYPCLFDGFEMRPVARERLLGYVLPVMEAAYPGAGAWSRFTVYGSGTSFNWDDTGDLDVQVWVDVDAYAASGGAGPGGVVSGLRRALAVANFPSFAELGLATEACAGRMLVQYYAKPGKGTREENLAQKPYACFDLDANEWIVKPEPLTPEMFAHMFLLVEPRARDIADQADDLLDVLERSIAEVTYWGGLADQIPDPRYRREAEEARAAAERAKAAVAALFDQVFRARGEAYTPGGQGVRDERDAVHKLLEVWGVFQKLKHWARKPLPWSGAT